MVKLKHNPIPKVSHTRTKNANITSVERKVVMHGCSSLPKLYGSTVWNAKIVVYIAVQLYTTRVGYPHLATGNVRNWVLKTPLGNFTILVLKKDQ